MGDKVDWDHDAAEEWFRSYAERSHKTPADLRALGIEVYPCICSGDDCAGWAAVCRENAYDHFQLYATDYNAPEWAMER